MKLLIKKYYPIIFACALTISACSPEEEKKYDDTKTVIVYDEEMNPLTNYGVYYYSNLDNAINVKFGVDAAASSVQVWMKPSGAEVYGAAQTLQVPSDKNCMVTYSLDELNWKKAADTAMVKIKNGEVTKEIILISISTWEDLGQYRAGESASAITTGETFNPVEAKPLNDTITFIANVDSWVNLDGATWKMSYKIGRRGTPVDITPVATDEKNVVLFVKSMSDLGITKSNRDTLIVSATITNNNISRTGSYTFVAKDLTGEVTSKISFGKTFAPKITKADNDTITFQTIISKKFNNRSWLKGENAVWSFSYKIGANGSTGSFDPSHIKDITKTVQKDTMSVVQLFDAFGQVSGLKQYDTLNIIGNMNISGANYPVKTFFVVKP